MKHLNNQQGFALVTALMLTFIALVIATAMLYLLTQNIKVSGAQKRYKSVIEASYGGSEVVMNDIIPLVFQGLSLTDLQNEFSGIPDFNLQTPSGLNILTDKLNDESSGWSGTNSRTLDPKSSPDLQFSLPASGPNAPPYTVYAKIVDANKGNTDVSGLQLEGAGVAEASSVVTPQHFPNIYRVEVASESSANASERANISLLYAY